MKMFEHIYEPITTYIGHNKCKRSNLVCLDGTLNSKISQSMSKIADYPRDVNTKFRRQNYKVAYTSNTSSPHRLYNLPSIRQNLP